MHTLEEIYDRVGKLESAVSALQGQADRLAGQLTALRENEGLLGWDLTVAVDGVNAGPDHPTVLAFSPAGQPSICYQDVDLKQLMLARFDGTQWAAEAVDAGAVVSGVHSHAYRPGGHPAAAYYDETIPGLKYAVHDGTAWQATLVDADGRVGEYASLAFDSRGYGVIAYYNATHGDLKLARQAKVGGLVTWQVQTVVSDGDSGARCRLVLDGEGNPAISTVNRDTGDVFLVMPNPSGGWIRHLLASPVFGDATALARRPDGVLGLLYRERSVDYLTLRTYPSSGTFAIPVTAGAFGIAFAPGGEPAVVVRDYAESSIKYAILLGEHWSIERVGPVGAGSLAPSLAFGPDGRPAVSLYDAAHRRILYATRPAP